jgi:hypothetical protein
MNEFIASGAIQSIKLLFQKKADRNVIIDPFSCLIKLSLLRFLDNGTKISIYQNSIHFNSPSYIQGIIRFMYGDNREHLHNLYLPIQKCVEWFWNEKNDDIIYMFNNAVIGLKMLKESYNEYATIQHTIDYYIIIIMQRNSQLISRMGFTTLDIEKITNGMIDCESHINSNINENNKNIIENSNITTSTTTTSTTPTNFKNKKNNSSINNTSNSKNSYADSNDNIEPVINTVRPKDIRDSIILTKNAEIEKYKDIHLKDTHKFLFELWNQREINIVINLYKEMESKSKGYERDNIFSNIMSYCSMKENKLYKYIESNSSIL